MDAALIWEWIIKSIILLLGLTVGFAYVTYYERKVLAHMQSRVGPNRAGPAGLLVPIADALKLIFKEGFTPEKADKVIYVLAPVICVIPALIITAVVPWGPTVNIGGRQVYLGISDINLIKPGIGEATRVLLRRVPERLIVRDTNAPDVAHLLLLAQEKAIPVIVEPALPYQAVALIRSAVDG